MHGTLNVQILTHIDNRLLAIVKYQTIHLHSFYKLKLYSFKVNKS
jgi:hypothetical protein